MDTHVIQAYKYLIKIYKPGDKIYLFGFSRGSFVARILAGMIEKIGLLDYGLDGMVKTAWDIYKTWEMTGQPNNISNPKYCSYSLRMFKQTFCRYNVSIEFMGLFDSINSCGIFRDRLFPCTSNTSNVKHIRHAVSIHERRAKFKQNLFIPHSYLPDFVRSNTDCSDVNGRHIPMTANSVSISNATSDTSPLIDATFAMPDEDSITRSHQIAVGFANRCSSDLLEVWFPGDHSDIGGCWPYDDNGAKIGNLPLRWILKYAVEFGVQFKENAIEEFNTKFDVSNTSLAYHHDSLSLNGYKYPPYVSPYCIARAGESNDQEVNLNIDDREEITTANKMNIESPSTGLNQEPTPTSLNVKSPLFPDFSKYRKCGEVAAKANKTKANKGHGNSYFFSSLFWWILEIIPIGYLVENRVGEWRPVYWPNLGQKRDVPVHSKIHWSVLWRMKFLTDADFSSLPSEYMLLQKLLDSSNEDEDNDVENDATHSNANEIRVELADIIDLHSGTIKISIFRVLKSSSKYGTRVIFDIDWSKPPNELSCILDSRAIQSKVR
jgi:uncharacterized protein (DUF2235 family)